MSRQQPGGIKAQRLIEEVLSIDVLQELVRLLTHRLALCKMLPDASFEPPGSIKTLILRARSERVCWWRALHALCSCSRFAREHLMTLAVHRTLLLGAKPSAGLHCLVTADAEGTSPFADAAARLVAERMLATALVWFAHQNRSWVPACAGPCCLRVRVDTSSAMHNEAASIGARLARLLRQPSPPSPRLLALHSHAICVGLVPGRDLFWALEVVPSADGAGSRVRCVLVGGGRLVATSDDVPLPMALNASLAGPVAHSGYVCDGGAAGASEQFSVRRWQPWGDDLAATQAGISPEATEYLRMQPLQDKPVPCCAILTSHGVIVARVAEDGRIHCSARWAHGSSNGGEKVVVGVAATDAWHAFVLYNHESVFAASPPQYSSSIVCTKHCSSGDAKRAALLPHARLIGNNVAWGKSSAIGLVELPDTQELVILLLLRGTLRARRCARLKCCDSREWLFLPGSAALHAEGRERSVSVHYGPTDRGAALMVCDRTSHAATVLSVTSDGISPTQRVILWPSPMCAGAVGLASDFYPSVVDFGPSGTTPTALVACKDATGEGHGVLLLHATETSAKPRFDFKGLNREHREAGDAALCSVTNSPLPQAYDFFGKARASEAAPKRCTADATLSAVSVFGVEAIYSFPGSSGSGTLIQMRAQKGALMQVVGKSLYTPLEHNPARVSSCPRATLAALPDRR